MGTQDPQLVVPLRLRRGARNGGFGAGCAVRREHFSSRVALLVSELPVVSAIIVVVWMVTLGIYGTRSTRILGNGLEETRRVLASTVSVFGVMAVFSMIFQVDIARGYLALALPAGLIGLVLSRLVTRRCIQRARIQGRLSSAVLAIGNRAALHNLAESFARNPADGLRLVGVCGPGISPDEVLALTPGTRVRVYCDDSDDSIVAAVRRCGADTVVLASGHLSPEEIRDLSWQLEKLDVELIVAPGMVDVAAPRLTVWLAGGQPLIRVEKPRYNGRSVSGSGRSTSASLWRSCSWPHRFFSCLPSPS